MPIAVEHYDRSISLMSIQNKIVVSYNFNKITFYGPSGTGIIINDADKYPFLFDIIIDQKSYEIYKESDF
ncbi:MAG: hypothetical protein PF692_05205 [Kiritimatiellae bacterium]|nr:hypothetical protein [Kiritimatiellia bacterium]